MSLSCGVPDSATKSCDFMLTKCLKILKLSWIGVLSEGSQTPGGLPNAVMQDTGCTDPEGTDRHIGMYISTHVHICMTQYRELKA